MADGRALVDKLWSYCHLLRHDGVSTLEYVEQLTYLLFLKMAEERATRRLRPVRIVPADCSWPRLLDASGIELAAEYARILVTLGRGGGVLGAVFRKAQNRIQNPANLEKLVKDLIDPFDWSAADVDVKGDAYEQLLARGASDVKSGAGQYFTPRPLIRAIVRCVQPTAGDSVLDPAAGTGGFLLGAYEYAADPRNRLDSDQFAYLQDGFVHGVELVEGAARLGTMNLLLHGIGRPDGDRSPIDNRDALLEPDADNYSVVLSNPPFGRKSSLPTIGADGREGREDSAVRREDFVTVTSNKQFNFVQHIMSVLDTNGRAAVVVPDNVLFEGGSGETIRRKLLDDFRTHTLLRLPTGLFYAQGVKANVLFFDKRPGREEPWTDRLWVYDLRTNQHFTLKQNPLREEHLEDFVTCYAPGKPWSARRETERFRAFTYEELVARDKANLDLIWLRDESLDDLDDLPAPEVIAREIVEDLSAALAEFEAVATALEAGPDAGRDGDREEKVSP